MYGVENMWRNLKEIARELFNKSPDLTYTYINVAGKSLSAAGFRICDEDDAHIQNARIAFVDVFDDPHTAFSYSSVDFSAN